MATDQQIRKLTRWFRIFDANGDRRIGASDFVRVAESLGVARGVAPDLPEHGRVLDELLGRWQSLRESVDADRNGVVDLAEWLVYWQRLLDDPERFGREARSFLEAVFEVVDRDEDGSVTPDELVQICGAFGIEPEAARRAFIELDLNQDARLSLEELVAAAGDFAAG